MKKQFKTILVIFFVLVASISFFSVSFADSSDLANTDTATELLDMKESTKSKISSYIEQYGSVPYGIVAYVLNIIRIGSIPACFLGIAWGVLKQYVTGIRRIDIRDRGFYLIISFVTILLICQVLPLIFAIIVRGWRG